ncbi:MAG: hypothetical protein E7413_02555 [Ruminococcaceae bacterium]|nr:hypothetical protein [Oscillospiraceae bacterium]
METETIFNLPKKYLIFRKKRIKKAPNSKEDPMRQLILLPCVHPRKTTDCNRKETRNDKQKATLPVLALMSLNRYSFKLFRKATTRSSDIIIPIQRRDSVQQKPKTTDKNVLNLENKKYSTGNEHIQTSHSNFIIFFTAIHLSR